MNEANQMRSSTPRDAGLATAGLGFSRPVPAGGYRWWYIDGFSDCGQFGITVIAFIGSVFSPYYFRSRSRGDALAEEHVSLNAILYGPSKSRWCMTERASAALTQSSTSLTIGPSALRLTDDGLTIEIDERATPFGLRVRGVVQIQFAQRSDTCFELDDAGEHWWWPIAPLAQMQVAMERPELACQGPLTSTQITVRVPLRPGSLRGTGAAGTRRVRGVRFTTMPSLPTGGTSSCRCQWMKPDRCGGRHSRRFSSCLKALSGASRGPPGYRHLDI